MVEVSGTCAPALGDVAVLVEMFSKSDFINHLVYLLIIS